MALRSQLDLTAIAEELQAESVAPTSPSRCSQRLIQLNARPARRALGCRSSREGRMPIDRVIAFSVELTRYLDAGGRKLGPLPEFATNRVDLVPLYQALLRTRAFNAKTVALQRTGRLGTFASSLGQEAVGVGAASAMAAGDVLVPSFCDQAAQLWRGVTPVELLVYWGGDERGSDFAGPRGDFPISAPAGSHVPHAAGAALAMKLHHEARATLCILGNGATSKGDFYEAINVAGVGHLPLVVLISDNQWAAFSANKWTATT
jgi:2-oxoisovalerate dehydrogenase E1 component alpha subunit